MIVVVMGVNACRALVGTAVLGTAVVVGTAGLAGYTVYKSGEAVATAAGSVGSSAVGSIGSIGSVVGSTGSSAVGSVGSTMGSVGSATKATVKRQHRAVVVSRGTFKATCEYPIPELYPTTKRVLEEADFKDVFGGQDSLAGALHAKTSFDEHVSVTFELLEKDLTAVEVRIGDGNLPQSEYLYDLILAALAADYGGGTK